MTTQSCGCVTSPDPAWMITRSVRKCEFHVAELKNQPTGEAYYRQLDVIDPDGNTRFDRYVTQMETALRQPFPPPPPAVGGRPIAEALEVGCGVSPYVRAVVDAGYRYTGVEPDEWGATRTVIDGADSMFTEKFDGSLFASDTFGLILAAHSLEHVEDAPGMLRQFFRILAPGGHLVLLVPDDTDLTNPDHLWFFTEATLAMTLARLGFKGEKLVALQVVPKEKFIYCHARKPEAR